MAARALERKGPTSGQRLQRGPQISGHFQPPDPSPAGAAPSVRGHLRLVLLPLLRLQQLVLADLAGRLHVAVDRRGVLRHGCRQRVHRRRPRDRNPAGEGRVLAQVEVIPGRKNLGQDQRRPESGQVRLKR